MLVITSDSVDCNWYFLHHFFFLLFFDPRKRDYCIPFDIVVVLECKLLSFKVLKSCDRTYLSFAFADIRIFLSIWIWNSGVSPNAIVVQSPYVAQVQLLRDMLDGVPEAAGLEVSTIDSFQGREADAVILSMVWSESKLYNHGFNKFLTLWRKKICEEMIYITPCTWFSLFHKSVLLVFLS